MPRRESHLSDKVLLSAIFIALQMTSTMAFPITAFNQSTYNATESMSATSIDRENASSIAEEESSHGEFFGVVTFFVLMVFFMIAKSRGQPQNTDYNYAARFPAMSFPHYIHTTNNSAAHVTALPETAGVIPDSAIVNMAQIEKEPMIPDNRSNSLSKGVKK